MQYKTPIPFLLGIVLLCSFTASANQSPEQLIKQASDKTMQALRANSSELKANPKRINRIIENQILPYFDFELISRWVLGKYWRQATPQQQKEFAKQFQELLISTYGNALLQYVDGRIEFPANPPIAADAKRATVEAIAYSNNNQSVKIRYQLLRTKSGQWKIYDVSVDNISLVVNYRSTFGSVIRRDGMDALLADLRKRNEGKS